MVSDEGLLMTLLAEGKPATELAEGASTGVPAATYLSTLEQTSSDMTQLETKKERTGEQTILDHALAGGSHCGDRPRSRCRSVHPDEAIAGSRGADDPPRQEPKATVKPVRSSRR